MLRSVATLVNHQDEVYQCASRESRLATVLSEPNMWCIRVDVREHSLMMVPLLETTK